jgi:histidinol dehydrogenase
MKIITGFEECRQALTRQTKAQETPISPRLAASLRTMFGTEDPRTAVDIIISEVRRNGDVALRDYSQKISGIPLVTLEISHEEMLAAQGRLDPALLDAIKTAAERVSRFHRLQFEAFMQGAKRMAPGTVTRVLGRVGLYVPGGTASYPSSVLMTAIPAKAAGVPEIVVCTPPGKDGRVPYMTLAAASIAGVDRLFAVGGAQAIAAMAYGTESIAAVDKICGPGNIFVMLAKKAVYGAVDIDGLQGPSEVLILADEAADPARCAAEMMAQAEHDALAQSVLVTTSRQLAATVQKEIASHLNTLSRKTIIEESLADHGIVCIVDSIEQAVALANLYAPEHLCLYVKRYQDVLDKINNAGCVFVGDYPTVVMGDYVAGPSHALPTGGTARFASPLNTTDFIRLMNVVKVDNHMVAELGSAAATLARAEGLTAHAQAIDLLTERGT